MNYNGCSDFLWVELPPCDSCTRNRNRKSLAIWPRNNCKAPLTQKPQVLFTKTWQSGVGKAFSSQNIRNLKSPKMSLNKGYFGDLRATCPDVLENVSAQLDVFCFRGWKSPQGLYDRSSDLASPEPNRQSSCRKFGMRLSSETVPKIEIAIASYFPSRPEIAFQGRDMGGCKTYGGRKRYQRTRPPEKFWTPPKELVFCSVVDFCTGKTEQRHPREWTTHRTRGVQNRFLGGVSFVRFSSPSFFHPPMHGAL